ncbi:MAG TPA: ParA family protein [Aggregatilinea sp.]|uniref:ParA family protein n=1 Tax=Aggregatilinea sp. TaxID=2806333 RepID=UPI002B86CD0F|nr:ParA family protein [Aggregatilinea sp.]HML24563.1 ParA family protein [Aggregatilinea sp.]
MARTLVIANQKGGVGKSTSVLNLGVALARRGQRVLLIDLDPQGGLTAGFGIDPYALRHTVYSLLSTPDASLARVLVGVGERLALVPANIDLAVADIRLSSAPDRAVRLRHALDRSRIPFDTVLIDTPPGLGVLTANGLAAADDVLIPVQCHYLAMRGVRAILDSADRMRASLNPRLAVLGLFGTLYRSESEHAREVMDELRDVFGAQVFKTVIPYDEAAVEAPLTGQPVLDYAPDGPAAQAYRALAEEMVRERAE